MVRWKARPAVHQMARRARNTAGAVGPGVQLILILSIASFLFSSLLFSFYLIGNNNYIKSTYQKDVQRYSWCIQGT